MSFSWGSMDILGRRERGMLQNNINSIAYKDSPKLLKRMTLSHSMKFHEGCVNTVAWSKDGRKILSGSDDCRLVISDPFQKRVLCSVQTHHHSNIFSAKFLPVVCDYKLVSCAGNGTVQYTEVDPTGDYLGHSFNCHQSITYQVVTNPVDPNEFLTCEERGKVRIFDLRAKNKCSCEGCDKDVCYSFDNATTALAINPLAPYYLGVGLNDGSVRVMDRRMPGRREDFVKYKPFEPDRTYRITSIQFNDLGDEILASYNGDNVYLFNFPERSKNPRGHCYQRKSFLEDGLYCPGKRRQKGTRMQERFPPLSSLNCAAAQNPKADSLPPLKRLRLRGDWSDTGPASRPDFDNNEQSGRLVHRMSSLLARWMNSMEDSASEGNQEEVQSGQPQVSSLPTAKSQPPSTLEQPASATSVESEDPNLMTNGEKKVFTVGNGPLSPGSLSSAFKASCTTSGEQSSAATSPPSKGNDADTSPVKIVLPEASSSSSEMDTGSGQSEVRGAEAISEEPAYLCYKGHRNSRTMIKQACFWGSDFVMSGSDCGRVFIWDKWTGEVVNMLIGDRHVVNCVQPHPEAFMLATSGIDYDIKIWEPLSPHTCQLHDLEEVMERNAQMLKEGQNIITVPSVLILRFLSYLNRQRRLEGWHRSENNLDNNDVDDSESD